MQINGSQNGARPRAKATKVPGTVGMTSAPAEAWAASAARASAPGSPTRGRSGR